MNHQIPLIKRKPKTVQTTPKVTARPLLEEFSEAILGFGLEAEEDTEVDEEVDDEEVDNDDDDDMSFALGRCTPRYLRLQVFDQGPTDTISVCFVFARPV